MKKIISSVLALVMIAGIFALIPMPAMAADATLGTTEVGKVEAGYKPTGTAIKNAKQFAGMTASGNYYLDADINIDASYTTAFTGVFDGNGHTVTVSKPMFAKLNGTVKNLTVRGSVTATGSTEYAASVALQADKKKSVLVENVVNYATVTGEYRAGGIFGQINSGSAARFVNCVNKGKVTGTNMVGGLLGYMQGYGLEMLNCVNNGDVGSSGNCGGIVGRFGEDKAITNGTRFVNIINCKNTGAVSSSTMAGGILGHARGATANIAYCVNEGAITSNSNTAAGIVSSVGTSDYLCTLNVTNCVNTGNVTMTAASPKDSMLASGIIGFAWGKGSNGVCTIDKCINLGTISSTFFASQLLGYSNNKANTIKNSIAAGKVEKYNDATTTLPVVFGLSNEPSVDYKISNLYYLENDGTEYYSYATAAANSKNIVKLADYLGTDTYKGKITLFTAAELASGKVGAQFNKLVGRDFLYQNVGTDAAPTTDSTHGKLVDTTPAKTAVKIKTAAEFAGMKADGYYVLEADIEISESYGTFNGTFDGNGHTVKTTVPLFKKLRGATVKNLVITGEIKSTENTGGLSENASLIRIENVINKANISSTKSDAYIGGLIGAVNQDEATAYAHEYDYFTGCVNYGNLSASAGTSRVAGIVGNAARYQHCVYTDCVNYGDITVSGSGSPYVAGIAGSSFGGEFYNCVNNGDIYSDAAAYMGGILAKGSPSAQNTDQSSTAVGCINNGNLTIKSPNTDGTLGGIFGNCGTNPGSTVTRAIYTAENCANFGTLTNNGRETGAIIAYIWGSNNVVKYSYGVVRGCVNAGKLIGQKNVETDNVTVFRGTFLSQFIGYVNANRTVIENSYGLGTLESPVDDYNVVFGLSGDTASHFNVNNVFLAPNDGTKNYSYGHDAMVAAKDEKGKEVLVLEDRSRNRLALTDNSVAGKVTTLTAAELESGKVAYTCNELLGKRFFYQNVGTDAAPTTDKTHATVYLYGDKYFSINEGGASVRAVGDSATVGVRFRSFINKDVFNAMKADVAEIGVIIAPKAIADAAGEMTFEALDAYKTASGKTNVYVTLKRSGDYAKSFSDEELNGGSYEIKGSLINVKDASMEFTAVGYVKLADGTVFYGSADTNSAKAVAAAAIADTKTAADAEYMYEVAPGVFSPYTKAAYESLKTLAK